MSFAAPFSSLVCVSIIEGSAIYGVAIVLVASGGDSGGSAFSSGSEGSLICFGAGAGRITDDVEIFALGSVALSSSKDKSLSSLFAVGDRIGALVESARGSAILTIDRGGGDEGSDYWVL